MSPQQYQNKKKSRLHDNHIDTDVLARQRRVKTPFHLILNLVSVGSNPSPGPARSSPGPDTVLVLVQSRPWSCPGPVSLDQRSGSVLSVLRRRVQGVSGTKVQRHRRPSHRCPEVLGRGHTQSSVSPAQSLYTGPQAEPRPDPARVGPTCVVRRSVGESQAAVGPVEVESRSGEDHRRHVPPRRLKSKLGRRAAVFGRRGGQRFGHQRRQRGGACVAFSGGLVEGHGGGHGASEEGTRPIVFKDLDRQRGHQRQQTVGDVSQDQLLVGVTADTDVGGASLKEIGEGGANSNALTRTLSLT